MEYSVGRRFTLSVFYFEVLTRNAMNNALRDWNFKEKGHRDWALEHQSGQLLYDMFKGPIRQARKWAQKESQRRANRHARKNAPLSHDDVVAQLTLGNWSNLMGEALPDHRSNAKMLWEECLHRAFPNAGIEDQWREDIGKKIERLTRLRNRVSHQENLLETNVRGRLNDLLSVLKAIDASYPAWAMKDTQVRRVAQEDPRKAGSKTCFKSPDQSSNCKDNKIIVFLPVWLPMGRF